jgi:hypothetical protein
MIWRDSRWIGRTISTLSIGGVLIELGHYRGFAGADQIVKSMKLAPTAWHGVSLRTIRTIEFLKVDGQWTPSDSYVGVTPPPPPCATARPREITELTPVAQSISCSAL